MDVHSVNAVQFDQRNIEFCSCSFRACKCDDIPLQLASADFELANHFDVHPYTYLWGAAHQSKEVLICGPHWYPS